MTKFVCVCMCTYRSEKTLIVSKTVLCFLFRFFKSLDININLAFKFKH